MQNLKCAQHSRCFPTTLRTPIWICFFFVLFFTCHLFDIFVACTALLFFYLLSVRIPAAIKATKILCSCLQSLICRFVFCQPYITFVHQKRSASTTTILFTNLHFLLLSTSRKSAPWERLHPRKQTKSQHGDATHSDQRILSMLNIERGQMFENGNNASVLYHLTRTSVDRRWPHQSVEAPNRSILVNIIYFVFCFYVQILSCVSPF